MAKRHARLRSGQLCVFCAGGQPATTVDHVPSRFLFKMKDRPKGLEVPACSRCNRGSSWAEDIAAMLAAVHLTAPDPDHFETRFNHLAKNNKAAVLEMYPSWEQEISAARWVDENGIAHRSLNLLYLHSAKLAPSPAPARADGGVVRDV